MEEEDVRGDRGLSVFRLRAVSRLTLVVRCTEIGYSVSTQVLGFRFGCGWCCVVGFLFGCCWFCVLLLGVSAWWNRGILDEVTKASFGRAVTGTAVMARSANEKKKSTSSSFIVPSLYTSHSLLPPLPLRFTAFYLLFPSSSCRLIRFPPPTGLSRSFRPTRSSALSGGSPLVALLGFSPSLRLDPVGHSGPLGLLFFFFFRFVHAVACSLR